MKAITLWQPWASLLACGAKKFETRSWPTNYRGPIAIHAAKQEWHLTLFQGNRPLQDAVIRAFGGEPDHERGSARGGNFNPPYGAVIATAELVGCYLMEKDAVGIFISKKSETTGDWVKTSYIKDKNELAFGDWAPGRYAWEFANMKTFDVPIPAKGRQGLWNWEGQS